MSTTAYREANRTLIRERDRHYRERNRETIRQRGAAYRATGRQRDNWYRTYGPTINRVWYDTTLADQSGGCAICGRHPRARFLAIDHDHGSGRVRGLLCTRCNVALGGFNDDPVLLRIATDYLERHSTLVA